MLVFCFVVFLFLAQACAFNCEDDANDCANAAALKIICQQNVTAQFCKRSCNLCLLTLLVEKESTSNSPPTVTSSSSTTQHIGQTIPKSQDNTQKLTELEKKIQDLVTKVDSMELSSLDDKKTISNLTAALTKSESEVQQLQNQVQRSEGEVRNVVAKNNQSFLSLHRMLSNLSISFEKQIEGLKQQLSGFAKKEPPVAFLVFSSRPKIYTHNGPVVFDTANFNIGNAYNTQNGIFMAPVAGIYSFSISVTGENGDVHGYIKLEGYTMGYVYADDIGSIKLQRASISVTIHCKKGDRVWFDWRDAGGQVLYGQDFTWFSGHLVYMDQ